MRNLGIEYPALGRMHFIDLGDPPEPGPNEVLIDTSYSGVTNGTERHALLGEHGWKENFPSRHGYQHVGVVKAVGNDVGSFDIGDCVFYGRYVGHRGWHIQDITASDASSFDSHLVIKLPDGIDREAAALMGVAGVGMRGVRRFRIAESEKVWVAGAGPIGLFAAQAALAQGAEVTITEVIPLRLSVASKLGVRQAFDASEKGYEEELARNGPYDCIIDACGSKGLLDQIGKLRLLGHGGVIGLLAVRSETTFTWGMLHGIEASMEVSCHFGLDDLRVLINLISEGKIRIRPMITHREPIEKAPHIYEMLRDEPSVLLGVVFDWTQR